MSFTHICHKFYLTVSYIVCTALLSCVCCLGQCFKNSNFNVYQAFHFALLWVTVFSVTSGKT